MISIEYFLAGIVFCSVIVPIMEAATVVIIQGLEALSGVFKIIVAKQVAQMEEITQPPTKTHSIGFSIEGETYDEEEED